MAGRSSSAAPSRPQSLVAWGVGVPFTTPALAQARVRAGRRGKPELILPSLGGAKGFYVVDVSSAPDVATLTVHDRLLVERLVALPAISPSEVRRVARALAIEGAAGREAARAADETARLEVETVLLIRFHLLVSLLREGGVPEIDWGSLRGSNAEVRATIKAVLATLAPRLRTTADVLLDRLEEVSSAASAVGPPLQGFASRNDQLLARLQSTIASLRQWAGSEDSAGEADARAIALAGDRTLIEARTAQDAARKLLQQPMSLLRDWCHPTGLAMRETLTRAEWLLDGWDAVSVLWASCARESRSHQRATLTRIQAMLPMLDLDRRDQELVEKQAQDLVAHRGRVRLHEDWRTGVTLLDGIAKAEALRAVAA